MNQFAYTDIFDTKGIEYIIVIGFLVLIIPVWILLTRPVKLKSRVGEALGVLTASTLRIPQGLFFSNNHTWSHMEKSGLVRVGMDDLLLHLTGGVELKYLKERAEKVKRGEPIARITQEGKELVIASPITGEIDGVHTSLEANSEALSEDPYGAWLLRIRPEKWKRETSSCFLAGEASEWAEKELLRFKDFVGETVLQEGGELIDHPLMELDQKIWKGFQEKFLDLEG
jgi:glycine cleavage system H protein